MPAAQKFAKLNAHVTPFPSVQVQGREDLRWSSTVVPLPAEADPETRGSYHCPVVIKAARRAPEKPTGPEWNPIPDQLLREAHPEVAALRGRMLNFILGAGYGTRDQLSPDPSKVGELCSPMAVPEPPAAIWIEGGRSPSDGTPSAFYWHS